MNSKSDLVAKQACCEYLKEQGFYNITIISSPADIKAWKKGDPVPYYFEIKMTRQKNKYFGAATLTEWKQAIETPDHYKFIVVQQDDESREFAFHEYSPQEFMKYSSIPPFKIYFNVDFNEKGTKREVTEEIIVRMYEFYKTIKN